MERSAEQLLGVIEDKFKLLQTEEDSIIKERYYKQLARLRQAVKDLDNKGEKSFWKVLDLILKPKYGPQHKEMKAIWAQYEEDSKKRKQELSSGQYLQPGGQDPSASSSTLIRQLASTCSLTSESHTGILFPSQEQSDAQQQQLFLSRPIWSQEDYQRFCADSEHQSQGLAIPPNSMTGQQGWSYLSPAPRSTRSAPTSSQPGLQFPAASRRRLPSDVSYSAVGGPTSSVDMPRASGESNVSNSAQEYAIDLITGNLIFPCVRGGSEGQHSHRS